eukprot:CAMPEP_0115134192 /NCGR_PEP_ID=MMETSP0227-20121206/54946_1 /TAXON_ID=89957 /ORGANISM="Polarella glacialis, Strain CCMP 1383" /LENGTH=41 /DNA_ID= /DNA_START= /DNA_END= /DNA_ORIENTATION=
MPLDTVKTYTQVSRTPGMTPSMAAKDIYKLKGLPGFYFGLP